MNYQHRFKIKASQSRVAAFHQQSSGMGAITPPPIRVELHRVPQGLTGEMDFTLWLGPLPVHWVAGIEDASEAGFTDRQLSGPFAQWTHRHSFVRVDEETTEVIDQVNLQLKRHPVWGPVGLSFALGLPLLFAYRAWKTRRLLEKEPVYA